MMATKTRDEWLARLYELEGEGDFETANKIRDALDMPRVAPAPTTAESAGRGAVQGATFGFSDELQGLVGAGLDRLTGLDVAQAQMLGEEADFGRNYAGLRDVERAENRAAQQANPWAYGAGEFGGGLLIPGGTAVKGAQATRGMFGGIRPLGALALSGGLAGAGAGAGYSEGATPGDVATDALIGGGAGAVLTPLLATGASAVGRGASNILGGLRRRLYSDPKRQARMRVARAMNDEGLGSVEQVRSRLGEMGPQGVLADIGPVLQGEAVVAAKSPGAGRRIANELVESRQQGQEGRLAAAARENIDPKWTDYPQYKRDVSTAAKSQAKEAYDAAYRVAITPTAEMNRISSTGVFQSAAKKAMKNMGNKLDTYTGTAGLQPDGTISTPFADQILREMNDTIGKASRSGAKERAADAIKIRNAFRKEIYDQNPDFARAQSIWRGKSQLEDAAEYGRDLLSGKKVRVDEYRDVSGDWSQSENDAFRVGLMQGIFDRLEDAADTQNSASRLVNSSRVKKLLKEAFGADRDRFDDFMRAVSAENRMQATRNKVTGGSPTYELSAAGAIGPDLSVDQRSGIIGTLHNLWLKLGAEGEDLKNLTPQDYEEMSKLLFGNLSDDEIQAIITPTLRSRLASSGVENEAVGRIGTAGALSAIGDYIQ